MIYFLISSIVCVEFINTINFEITETQIMTKDKNGNDIIVNSYSATYVPTIFKLSNEAENTPNQQTNTVSITNETDFNKTYYRPEFCIGATSLLLLCICFLYTSCCYHRQANKYILWKKKQFILKSKKEQAEPLQVQINNVRKKIRKKPHKSDSENEI